MELSFSYPSMLWPWGGWLSISFRVTHVPNSSDAHIPNTPHARKPDAPTDPDAPPNPNARADPDETPEKEKARSRVRGYVVLIVQTLRASVASRADELWSTSRLVFPFALQIVLTPPREYSWLCSDMIFIQDISMFKMCSPYIAFNPTFSSL